MGLQRTITILLDHIDAGSGQLGLAAYIGYIAIVYYMAVAIRTAAVHISSVAMLICTAAVHISSVAMLIRTAAVHILSSVAMLIRTAALHTSSVAMLICTAALHISCVEMAYIYALFAEHSQNFNLFQK